MLSGLRHPYQQGDIGVVKEGAYADMLIVDGNPLDNIEVLTDPEKNLRLIMKDGVVYKKAL
jgi:imidazolonepropionase-like amidohydrolase